MKATYPEDEIDFTRESPCFHPYPEVETLPDNEFDNFLAGYDRFITISKMVVGGCLLCSAVYSVFKIANWLQQ